MDNFGLALKILRKRFSLTQTELADKIGVSNHAVSKWENGVNQPDVSTLQTICKLFDITMDQFMRLAAGESEESVFKKEECSANKKVVTFDKSKFYILLISVITALVIALTVGIVFLVRSLEYGQGERELKGTQKSFLKEINNAIKLKDGVNEYDYVGKLKYNDKTNTVASFKLVIEKRNGKYKRYYVKNDAENLDVYSDFEYFYITDEYGENLRLEKGAYDLSEYLEDVEELYSLEDLTTISARKIGKTYEYSYGFKDEYIKDELKEVFDELEGVIFIGCNAKFTVSENSTSETISIEFIYQGMDYEFTATRQLNLKSSFTFPNFSNYKKGVDVGETLNDVEIILNKTKNLTSYKKTIFENQSENFSIATTNSNSSSAKSVVTYSPQNPVYYLNGKTYGTTTNYEGSFNYYQVSSFNEFFETATKYLSAKSLITLDFNILESYVATIHIDEIGNKTAYTIFLSQSGVD